MFTIHINYSSKFKIKQRTSIKMSTAENKKGDEKKQEKEKEIADLLPEEELVSGLEFCLNDRVFSCIE